MLAIFRGFSGSRSLTPEIYVELVRLLFGGRYPTVIFIAVLILAGTVLWLEGGDSVTIGLVTRGVMCSLARLLVLRSFGQTAGNLTLDEPTARLWERRYVTSSILMSLATGAIGARCFLSSDI